MVQAFNEDVIPDAQLDEGMDDAPEPTGYGADVALLEVAADELDDEGSASDQVLEEVAAWDAESGGHASSVNSKLNAVCSPSHRLLDGTSADSDDSFH